MKVVDANVLVHAANAGAREHTSAQKWIEAALSGTEPIGFAWTALLAFIRISTRQGLLLRPLKIADAFGLLEDWLGAHHSVVIHPGDNHAAILRVLLESLGTAGDLTTDAHLAALAIEHGAELVSFDRDFKRFEGLRTVILKA
jgi:toxin-antitoxin system PIN domain toxin